MNKKHGVGCTTLAYNLGRLFKVPIYVDKDSFMLDTQHKELFPSVSKITASKKSGIFDIGADYNKSYVKKFINQAKVIVIPMEFGYESIISTIETIKYIREIDDSRSNPQESDLRTPIVLVLNRLDKQDSARDFNYKEYLTYKLEESDITFYNSNIVLTYLRNSYALYSNLDIGEYFLDKLIQTELFEDKVYNSRIKHFEYKIFIYITNETLSSTNYFDERIYIQDKDMVRFRNNFKDTYRFYEIESHITNNCKTLINKTNVYKEDKLIKDMAFISHNIFKYITDERHIKRFVFDI